MIDKNASLGWLGWVMGAVGWVFGWLPRRVLGAVGWALGMCWFYIIPVRRRLMLAHLRVAGRFSDADAWRMARGVLVTQAKNVVQMLGWRRLLRAAAREPIRVEGEDHLTRALALGKGVLLVSAHLGAFDWVASHQAVMGRRLHVVSKRLSWGAMDAVWMQARARLGLNILPPEAPLQPALAALRAGEIVLLVLDQHSPEPRAIETPFMDVPARTSAALATLALRTGAPVLPCFTVWEPDGGHRLWFEAPLEVSAQGDTRARTLALTQKCLRALEGAIFRYPQQWLWLHRRWKDTNRKPLI